MTRSDLALAVLIGWLACSGPAGAAGPMASIHNPNGRSAECVFHLPCPADTSVSSHLRVGDQLTPVDLVDLPDGQVMVGTASLEALASVSVEPANAGPEAQPMARVRTGPGETILQTRSGVTLRFTAGKLAELTVAGRDDPLPLAETPLPGATAEVLHNGPHLLWVRLAGGGRQRDYRIYANGLIEVRANRYRLLCPAGSEWHSYKPTIGLGLVRITGENVFHFHAPMGQSSRENYGKCVFPMEWLAVADTDTGRGVWVKPASPDTLCSVDFDGDKTVTLTARPGRQVTVQLRPLADPSEGRAFQQSAAPLLVTAGADRAGTLPFTLDGKPIGYRAEDLDGDGVDLSDDRWTWTVGGREVQVWQFAASDAGLELRCHVDDNSDGRVADYERQVPFLVLTDWNNDGRFFHGPALFGGFLVNDRYRFHHIAGRLDPLAGAGGEAYDLNADGIVDIARIDFQAFLNFDGRDIGPTLSFTPWMHKPTQRESRLGDGTWFLYTHGSCSRFNVGGLYKGGLVSLGEQHYSINLHPDSPKPETKFRTVSGGNFIDAWPTPSYVVSRITLGNLDGRRGEDTYGWNLKFSSEREGQQPHDLGEGIHEGPWVSYRDPAGHEVRLRCPFYPKDWNGEKLEVRPQSSLGGDPALMPEAPWRTLVTNRYPRAFVLFEPQGVPGEAANEGMHSWIPEHMIARRWEPDHDPTDGTLTLYYSSLFRGVHFKGADHGAVNAGRDSWSGGDGRMSKDGIPLTVATGRTGGNFGDSHRHRRWGDRFLYYRDTDGDGYFDLYLWDKENDGRYDTSLFADVQAGSITLRDGNRLAAWGHRPELIDAQATLEGFDDCQAIWRTSWLQPSAAEAWSLDDAGRPTTDSQDPERFVTLSDPWLPTIAVDRAHTSEPNDPWRTVADAGLMRLNTELAERRWQTTTLTGPWTDDRLAEIDALILHRLDRMPTEAEADALARWVRGGGRLMVLDPDDDASQRCLLNVLLDRWELGFAHEAVSADTLVWRRPNYGKWGEGLMRINWQRTRIGHFASDLSGLLDGLRWASFAGRRAWVGADGQVLLSYDDQPIVVGRPVGQGRVMICSADLPLSRRYMSVFHNDTEARVDNIRLLNRLLDHWLDGIDPPALSADDDGRSLTVTVTGRGGKVLLPAGRSVAVNGRPAETTQQGPLVSVTLTGDGPWRITVR